MKNYPHIASRVFNTPLLIHPAKLEAIIAGLGSRLLGIEHGGFDAIAEALSQSSRARATELGAAPEMFSTKRGERADRGYRVVDGVAVISAMGALVHRTRMDADSTFLLGYNDMAADVEDAMQNPDVHAVLQVYDSPGGEAQGAFEHADRIFALRGQKPLKAIADGMAASAAFLGAAAADELVVTGTGYVGSIGVVMRHVDLSRALANEGVSVTHIYAGAHKVDGNQFAPLPQDVRADYQAEVDSLHQMFVDAVSRYLGLTAEQIYGTQARTYRGVAAVAARLASRISTTDQMISELSALRARTYPVGQSARITANDEGEMHMSGTTAPAGDKPHSATTTASQFAQVDIDQARAAGVSDGAKAERERVAGILAHASAAEQTALVHQCISNGLTVEQSSAILGAAHKPAALESNSATTFAAAMSNVQNPAVSGVEAAAGVENEDAAMAAQILTAYNTTSK